MKKRILATIIMVIMAVLFMGRPILAAENVVFQENPYDEVIPSDNLDDSGERTPLGISLPENDEWEEDGKKPLFLYTHPEKWEALYYLEGSKHYIAKAGDHYLEISLMGQVGPVWAYTSDSCDRLIARTTHCFIFSDENGKIFAREEGAEHLECLTAFGNNYEYNMLPEEEKDTLQMAHCVNMSQLSRIYIDSWYDIENLERSENGVTFKLEMSDEYKWLQLNNPVWYQLDDRAFFVQDSLSPYGNKEAVFIAYDGRAMLTVKFNGDFCRADGLGVYYHRDGEEYFKSYSPIWVGGTEINTEVPANWIEETEVQLQGDYNSDEFTFSIPLRGEPLF